VYPCRLRRKIRRWRRRCRWRRETGQRLQLVGLHRRGHHPELREGHRHQG